MDIFDESFNQKLFKVYYDDVEVKFSMILQKSFELNVNWESVKMRAARMDDCERLFSVRDQDKANRHMEDFFKWSLDLILPWVQYHKPPGLCKFELPVNIPKLLHFNEIKMAVEENFLSFGLDLWFNTNLKE